jgi:hypothetical protein
MKRFWLIAVLLILGGALFVCKESSTAPEAEIPPETDISVTLTPVSGGTGTVFTVDITLGSLNKEIKVFGLDMSFDAELFQFQGVNKGNLTGDWAAVDGNEIHTGILKVGGFAGSGTPIPASKGGTIAEIVLKVIGEDFSDGQKSQICINSYTDDISGLTPMPACTSFELKK